MISKEEAKKIIADEIDNISISLSKLVDIKDYLNTPKLDSDVEEAIKKMEDILVDCYVLDDEKNAEIWVTIRTALSDKDRQLNQVREYANKWKDSKCVNPDANVLAIEIIEILGDDNNE